MTKKSIIYFSCILFALLITKTNYSQEPNIVQYSIAEGLPQSQVNKIIFDSRGMLWAATSGGGITSFDGLNFTTFDENNGLAGNIVFDIAEDKNGKIYSLSSWGGITVIENSKITNIITYQEGMTGMSAIETDTYGTVWVGGSVISYIEDGKLIPIVTDIKLPFSNEVNIKCFGEDIYITSNNRLIIVNSISKKQTFSKSYPFDISVVYLNSRNELMIGTSSKGLYKEYEGELVKVNIPSSKFTSTISITDIYQENNNKYWLSSKNGAYCIEDSSIIYYAQDKGFAAYDLTSICFDAQGNVWFGSRGEGVIGIVNTAFSFYSKVYGLNKSDNFPIYEDAQGRVWVGNNEEGLFIYDGKKVTTLTTADGLTSNSVRTLARDGNGDLLVGTKSGLNIVTNDFKIKTINTFDGQYVKSILKDKEGNSYIGTVANGLWILNTNGTSQRIHADEIKNVYSLCFDKTDNIVVGTNAGCYININGGYRMVKDSLKNTYIGNITLDKNGKIWAGTDRSISRLEGNHFINYDTKNGLKSDLIYVLFADSQGYLWAGSNKGLDRITLDAKSEIVKIKHFGYDEGFKGMELNSKGFYENTKGEIYFSTVQGIHKYIPRYDYNFSYNTPVYINNVKLLFKEIDASILNGTNKNWFGIPEKISLEPDQNHLTFNFFAVDYLNPKGVQYTFYLEGFDKEWSPPTNSRDAIYSNLPPGNYIFKVKQYGNEFSQIATLKVFIKRPPPPFYKSIWFLVLALFIIALIVYYFTEYRTIKLKNQQAYLESKIEERTQELQEREQEKTVLLQEVHHRVKNNLQIIISLFRLQTYFTDNEEAIELFKNSQNRIRSMSKIHEKLYETKDLSKVEIKGYITELVQDLVSSYDISNKVKIKTKIENCIINLDELTPLALIINEMITNSMKYAFKENNDPTITVDLTQDIAGNTVLTVADNGPGFDRKIWDEHQTMGVELIKTLTEQLDGTIELSNESNSPTYILKFKATL